MSEQKNINRRTLLRHLTVGGLAACPICAGVVKAKAGEAHHGAGVEGITWTVFGTPVKASTAQIAKFAALFVNNARPVQSRNRRYLLESF